MLRSLPVMDERRGLSLNDAQISIRDMPGASAQKKPRYYGYAAVFNQRTSIGNPLTWGFYEELAAGAFTKTLQEGDARMLIDHDSYYVVSRVSAGTLALREDPYGLVSESDLDERLSYVNDLIVNVDVRNITGMSFGFRVTKDDWFTESVSTSDGNTAEVEVRIIREVKLIEVSAVTFPAYEQTTAGLRYSLVPALLRRNDPVAIARAARARPDLAPYLGYDPDLAPTVMNMTTKTVQSANTNPVLTDRELEVIDDKTELPPPGEMLGEDVTITPVEGQMEPREESDDEPVEATRIEDDSDTNIADKDSAEPVEATRNAPNDAALARVRLAQLRAKLRSN